MPTIAMTEFCRSRHTPDARSHFSGGEDELVRLVEENFDKAKPGYREGVLLVPVPSEGFWSGIVQLKSGFIFLGKFAARKEGEEPRKQLFSAGKKMPAKSVDIILYRHDVLAETDEAETDADWEIISINASPDEEEIPMDPMTMMYNHFELSGGTKIKMNDADFLSRLRKSCTYWNDKVMAG